jgi:hypothetical protein
MRYEDLPAKLRAQVDSRLNAPVKPKRRKGGGSVANGNTWICHSCGSPFTVWAKAERHVDEDHGAGRLDIAIHHPKRDD